MKETASLKAPSRRWSLTKRVKYVNYALTEVDMIKVAATEFSRNFGRYQRVVQREIIEVCSHDQTTGFYISPEDFQQYQSLLAASRQAYHPSELPPHLSQAIADAQMDPQHDHLNRLMDE